MSDAALIFKDDGKGGIVMTARYDGGWDYNSKAHMVVYKVANSLGEPTGEPIVEVGDKKAEPKVVLARA